MKIRVPSSLSSPTVNTESGFYCKTHGENAYYFLKVIIACFFSSISVSDRKGWRSKQNDLGHVYTLTSTVAARI